MILAGAEIFLGTALLVPVGGGEPVRVQLWVVVGWRLGILPLLGVGGTGTTDHAFHVVSKRAVLACAMLIAASLHSLTPLPVDW